MKTRFTCVLTVSGVIRKRAGDLLIGPEPLPTTFGRRLESEGKVKAAVAVAGGADGSKAHIQGRREIY
jgi:hypothetical protein